MVFISREDNNMVNDLNLASASTERTFWPFSARLYNKSQVKESCGCLRHKYGLNINMIMFCCWAAAHDYQLSQEDVAFIVNKIMPWNQSVVEELKKVYARLAETPVREKIADIFDSLLENILMAEKAEQSIILRALDELKKETMVDSNKMKVATRNIFNYINSQQVLVHKTDLEKVYRIVTECFEEE